MTQVQTEIDRLESAKEAISTAIAGKGVTVPDGTMLDGMAALIDDIPAGGEWQYASGSFTATDPCTTATITGLGFKPKVVFAYSSGSPTTTYQYVVNMQCSIEGNAFGYATGGRYVSSTVKRQLFYSSSDGIRATFNDDGFVLRFSPYYARSAVNWFAGGIM